MKIPVFIDSNVWIYAITADTEEKNLKAKKLLKNCFLEYTTVISYQVLNEVSLHLKRSGFTEERIRNIILAMEKSCAVVDFTLDLLLRASELREKHQFSFWDSLIIACSIEAGCKILYSEDMQDGRKVECVTIQNPL